MDSKILSVAVDCRLMFYRKAGISNYTRRLVQAMGAIGSRLLAISLLMDRRDKDTAWVPSNCKIISTVTPAHHKYEHLTLPLELARHSSLDICHFPDFIACAGRFKKVITIHDLYFMEHAEAMSADGARYYGRVRQSAQRADKIIAVSHFTRNEILRLMPGISPTKVAVIHEAADTPITNNQQPITSPLFALFVGTFEPRKNLMTLLRALAHTQADFKLVIVGESGWVAGSEPLQLAKQLGVSDKVQLAGRVSDDELDKLYRNARFVLVPSLAEGFGLTALEAMSRGTPVICSTGGSLPEIVGDAALLHAPTNAAQLANLMTQLWRDDALQQDYAQRAKQRASQFSWAKSAHETWVLYRASNSC